MLNNTQMQIVDIFCGQIKDNKEVSLHQVSILLEYAPQDVKSKKDLSDADKLHIKSIRAALKGL